MLTITPYHRVDIPMVLFKYILPFKKLVDGRGKDTSFPPFSGYNDSKSYPVSSDIDRFDHPIEPHHYLVSRMEQREQQT